MTISEFDAAIVKVHESRSRLVVEIIRLNRQLDATIRELNAIPLTIRR